MPEYKTQVLSLKTAYDFGNVHGLQAEISEIRHMVIEWDLLSRAGLVRPGRSV